MAMRQSVLKIVMVGLLWELLGNMCGSPEFIITYCCTLMLIFSKTCAVVILLCEIAS